MKEAKCLKCGWEWSLRVDQPKACPKCKRYDWKEVTNIKVTKHDTIKSTEVKQ